MSLRLPAEWEPHQSTWLSWPHNSEDWPGKFATIPFVYLEILRHLIRSERVTLLVPNSRAEARVRRLISDISLPLDPITFLSIPTDRSWCRDYGPIFLEETRGKRKRIVIAGFRFNGWGRYLNYRRDAAVPRRAAHKLSLPLLRCSFRSHPIVLEGGAIDVNGRGTLLTTEECLLDRRRQPRNPDFSKTDYRRVFTRFLGAPNVVWLARGLAGDDTGGHVDQLARFVNPTTILTLAPESLSGADAEAAAENLLRLRSARLENGRRPTIITVPAPQPIFFRKHRLPASYLNFYIADSVVLVPTFNDPRDRTALELIAECFPDREVVGIHSVDLAWGFGSVHCSTQQQPAVRGEAL
ncbi:MAG: agmatine deiminase family protein [Candidatus Hydrogenedentota bacterium]|nr:MAG: agmatine deiminase family protein [Candidatus Hydrogenedentota bacterium]